MSAEGWIKMHRKIQDNPIWLGEKFTRGQAWIDLVLLANHKPSFFYKRDIKVTVERGQCGVSEVGLSDRWKWSRTKVRKFLKDLEKEQQLHVEKNNVSQIVTVLNYDKYQSKVQQEDSKRTAKEQQEDINKNEKNEKNTITGEKPPYSERFELFWKEYPNKKGKHKAFTSWKRFKCDNGIFDSIMDSLKKQKQSDGWVKDNGKYIPHGSTWVNGKKWEDEPEVNTGGRRWY